MYQSEMFCTGDLPSMKEWYDKEKRVIVGAFCSYFLNVYLPMYSTT